jgi:hypothetical protein
MIKSNGICEIEANEALFLLVVRVWRFHENNAYLKMVLMWSMIVQQEEDYKLGLDGNFFSKCIIKYFL